MLPAACRCLHCDAAAALFLLPLYFIYLLLLGAFSPFSSRFGRRTAVSGILYGESGVVVTRKDLLLLLLISRKQYLRVSIFRIILKTEFIT